MFGKSSNLDTFGVPADTLRSAGQSQASDADQNLARQENAANSAASSQYQIQLNAAKDAANLADNAYNQKKLSDYNFNQLTKGSTGGSTGVAGYSDGLYNYDPVIGGSPFMPTVSYQKRENPQVAIMTLQNQLQQQNADSQLSRNLTSADHDLYNQRLLSSQQYQQQSNLQSSQLANQQAIAQIDANSRFGAATIGAQGSVLGSLFGSISGGQINGRYWQ